MFLWYPKEFWKAFAAGPAGIRSGSGGYMRRVLGYLQ